jgi:alkanesulfonate monooxygenase
VNIDHYVSLVRSAEQAKFDLIFFADSAAVRDDAMKAVSRAAQYTAYFEPTTLLASLAMVTQHIGLVATATTSYNEPYNIARRYASLDHISHGRAGWNVVTSGNAAEAYNFGRDEHYNHAARYDRAREFVHVVKGLWDSWDDDAFVRDRESGLYFDPAKLHYLRHSGKHFTVRGPLNVPRPVQGYPVIFQAGTSEDGRELAAETAEAVFTAELTLEGSKAYYQDVKTRMAKYGRRPDQLKVMPGVNPVVAATDGEARDKHEFLQSLIHPDVGLEYLSLLLGGVDLSPFPIDGPLPDLPETDSSKSGIYRNVVSLARREDLSIRQLYLRLAGARGKRTIIGSASYVADQFQEWFDNDAADGFVIQPSYLPGALDEFTQLVIPMLQDRGIFRTQYEGVTLRENLGLDRPPSRYATKA